MPAEAVGRVGRRVWLWAALVATVTWLQFPLLAVYRGVWTSRFPSYAAHWPNDGPLALVGGYGTDNMDELDYVPMVQEVARRWVPHDPWVASDSVNLPSDYLPFAALGAVQRVTRDATWTWMIVRWLAGFFWFVGLFRLARRCGVPDEAAGFCAAFGTAFAYLVGLFFLKGLHWQGGLLRSAGSALWTVATYGRTENVWRLPRPGLTYPALFAAALVWYRAALSEKGSALVAAGLAGGVLCYVRFDVASGLLGAMLLFPFMQAAARRRWQWCALIPAALALALGFPVLRWAAAPPPEFLLKAGMAGSGAPDWESLVYLPLLAWALARRGRDTTTLQTCALLLAVLAVCWLPPLAHRSVYTPNWRAYGNLFGFALLLSLLPRAWLEGERFWRAATLATLLAAAGLNVVYAGIRYPWQGLPADYARAMAWLRANAADEAVVAALSPEANNLIPAFTRCKTLMADGAPMLSKVPLEEGGARAVFALSLFGVEPRPFFADVVARASSAEPRVRLDRVQADWSYFYTRLFCKTPVPVALQALEPSLAKPPRRFPVHYVWTGPFERSVMPRGWPGKKGPRLERVYGNATVQLDRLLAPMPSSSGAVPGELSEPGQETP